MCAAGRLGQKRLACARIQSHPPVEVGIGTMPQTQTQTQTQRRALSCISAECEGVVGLVQYFIEATFRHTVVTGRAQRTGSEPTHPVGENTLADAVPYRILLQ